MTWIIVGLILSGLFLSAFFSGHETGFYRVARLRLLIDALRGNSVSRGILWLTNNTSLFVATTLIGNNIANYITSLGIVLASRSLVGQNPVVAEIAAPIALSPFLFVYGELLPKYLFFQAPNRLLYIGGYLFLTFTFLLMPLTLLLWGMGQLLEKLLRQSPDKAIQSLARSELRQIFQEGEDAGVLHPAQRELAYNLVTIASESVVNYAVPPNRFPSVEEGSLRSDAIRIARRNRLVVLPIRKSGQREPVGYVSAVDLNLQDDESISSYRPLISISNKATLGDALLRMQSEKASLARIIDEEGKVQGIVSANHLFEPLLTGGLTNLRR